MKSFKVTHAGLQKVQSYPRCCPHADTRQFISIMSSELVSTTVEVRTQNNVEILNRNFKYSSIHILIPIPLLPIQRPDSELRSNVQNYKWSQYS